MNCEECKFMAKAYDGEFKWCNKYRCKIEEVEKCSL